MKEELLKAFPEFKLIKDDFIRKKSQSVWKEAMTLGGWTIEDLDDIPFTLLIPDCSIGFRKHVQAVTHIAIQCAKVLSQYYSENYSLNMDHIIAGSLLHDVGKLLEYSREGNRYVKSERGRLLRHPISGAALAAKHGLPKEIVHIIAAHSREGDVGYRSPEAVIVHHADFINFQPLYNLV